jgi:threonyl-tRNA synthetase
VVVLPISQKHADYTDEVVASLKEAGIRVELSEATESLGKRIRASKMQKVPYTLVIGDEEMNAGTATLESRDKGKIGAFSIADIIARLSKEINMRSLVPLDE